MSTGGCALARGPALFIARYTIPSIALPDGRVLVGSEIGRRRFSRSTRMALTNHQLFSHTYLSQLQQDPLYDEAAAPVAQGLRDWLPFRQGIRL